MRTSSTTLPHPAYGRISQMRLVRKRSRQRTAVSMSLLIKHGDISTQFKLRSCWAQVAKHALSSVEVSKHQLHPFGFATRSFNLSANEGLKANRFQT